MQKLLLCMICMLCSYVWFVTVQWEILKDNWKIISTSKNANLANSASFSFRNGISEINAPASNIKEVVIGVPLTLSDTGFFELEKDMGEGFLPLPLPILNFVLEQQWCSNMVSRSTSLSRVQKNIQNYEPTQPLDLGSHSLPLW